MADLSILVVYDKCQLSSTELGSDHRVLYRLDNDTPTTLRYQGEIIELIVRTYTGAVAYLFLLVHQAGPRG